MTAVWHMVFNLGLNYFVDPSSKASSIELGTQSYPFKAMDDPFREIFNYGVISMGGQISNLITINLK